MTRRVARLLAIAAPLIPASPARARVVFEPSTTSYCQTGRMADGTFTRARSAASNLWALGTRLRLVGRQAGPGGLRRWVIRDRVGAYSRLDFWQPTCSGAIAWGRRPVRFRIERRG